MNQSTPAPTQSQTITMNSDFSYDPPPAVDPAEISDFQSSLKDIVSEIEGEWAPAPEDGLETQDAPEADLEAKPDDQEQPGNEPAAPDQDDPAVARGMERLVSREVALQAKEAAFQAREARVATLEAEVKKLRASAPAADLTERIGHSPTEVIKALGGNPEQVVKMLIAEQLTAAGKEVPAALKEELRDAAMNRELDSLKRQLAARDASEKQAAFFNSVAVGARQYVTSTVGAAVKNLPTLSAIAKTSPERAHRELMEEITADARNRAATDPDGEPLSYEEAAARVEARLSSLKALLSPTVSPADTKQAPVGRTPPTTKPPARPLRPWEKTGGDLESQGIEEAMREFHKLESAARRPTR